MVFAVRIAILIVFGGLGLVMLGVGITQFFQQRRLLANATAIEADIIDSRIESSTSANTDRRPLRSTSTTTHAPVVKFRYNLDGKTYESDLLTPTIIVRTYPSREGAEEQIAPYPIGAKVTALVDPSRPEKAFLIAQASAAPMVFIIIGLLLPPIAWLSGKLV